MYQPKVLNPNLPNNIPQMRSEGFQKPFFFGGSQTPVSLGLSQGSFSGSGMVPVRSAKDMPQTLRNVVLNKKGLTPKPFMPSVIRK